MSTIAANLKVIWEVSVESIPAETHTDEALSATAKAVEVDPDDCFCTTHMDALHLQRLEYEQARHYLEMALKSKPHDTWRL